jgi:hypothetical protein
LSKEIISDEFLDLNWCAICTKISILVWHKLLILTKMHFFIDIE